MTQTAQVAGDYEILRNSKFAHLSSVGRKAFRIICRHASEESFVWGLDTGQSEQNDILEVVLL